MKYELVNRTVLILVLVAISALFLVIVKPFLVAIFLAALFSTLFHPLYERFLKIFNGRKALASFTTLFIAICFVFVPVFCLLTAVVSQALDLAALIRPWAQEQMSNPDSVSSLVKSIPFYEHLLPFQDVARERVGELFGSVSLFFLNMAQAATVGTFNALLMGFIVLYTMFFLSLIHI